MRIFTPALELPFAGHPILGTAFVLAGPLQLVEIRLECDAGVVPVRIERDGSRIVFGWMTQPPFSHEPYADADALLALLGLDTAESPVELYRQGPQHSSSRLRRRRRSPRFVPTSAPSRRSLPTAPRASRVTATRGRRASLSLRMASPRTRPPARPPGRSRFTSPARADRFGDEIEIHQGAEIDRPSTL